LQNSYNLEGGSNNIKQALSAAFYGDKSAIFNCSFMSYQDTLFAARGRHYFKDCYIQGDVDFIFGSGQSYFEVKHRHTFLLFNIFWFNYIFVFLQT